jgi:hypothetical protein
MSFLLYLQEVLCLKQDRKLFELTKRLHSGRELPVTLDYSRFEESSQEGAVVSPAESSSDIVNEMSDNEGIKMS